MTSLMLSMINQDWTPCLVRGHQKATTLVALGFPAAPMFSHNTEDCQFSEAEVGHILQGFVDGWQHGTILKIYKDYTYKLTRINSKTVKNI